MSTELGMIFGEEYGDEYAKIIEKWEKRLKGIKKSSEVTHKEWSRDLRKVLEPQMVEALVTDVAPRWKQVGTLPSEDTVQRFAQIAVRASLQQDTNDLLERLRVIAQRSESDSNSEPNKDALTAGFFVSTLIKRSSLAVAQMFDMVTDRFDGITERFFQDKNELTGRRRWQTASTNSRHKSLDGEIKEDGESFEFAGISVYGPRPSGGPPEYWSNCSCYLEREKSNGDWIRIT